MTVACLAPLSKGFFRKIYWSGFPFPPPGDLPDPGIEPVSLTSPLMAGGFFTTSATWEAYVSFRISKILYLVSQIHVHLYIVSTLTISLFRSGF